MKITVLFSLLVLFILTIPVHAQSLLWEITGKGIKKPSYLYGTIHIQDKRVFAFGDIVEQKLKECDAYAMEVLLDELNKEDMQNAILMKDNTLDKLMSKEDYDLLDKMMKEKTGSGIMLYNKMKPFFIMSQLMQTSMKQDMPLALDMYFLDIARKNRKEALGIETFEQQMAAVDQISLKEQVKMMMESIKDTTTENNKFDELLETYLKADLDKMLVLSNDSTMPANFNEAFLINRNVWMTKQIAKFCKKQQTFNAIGAAHLGGSKGVISLLRQKGLKVEPVKFDFKTTE